MTEDRDPPDVLLVEDNPGDVRLAEEAFGAGHVDVDLHVVSDGAAALDFLHRRPPYEEAPRPTVVLLDLNLPSVDGLSVLEAVKSDPDLRRIPVIVLTSSEADEDIARSYDLHSNAYLTKPIDPGAFVELVRTFEDFWFRLARLPSETD